ncbi:MAG: carbohydrate kinase family protein [Chloroflexota bacterium]|nr:carbohydrate kinase family protein [Chloroflexota bacterium]
MSSDFDVVVLGAAAVDMVARVDRLPDVDEIVFAREYIRHAGGSGANTAVALARLGRAVSFLGKVGDDESGEWLRKNLSAAGVDTQAVLSVAGGKSASCFIALDAHGNRVIFALGGSALIESVDELDLARVTASRALCIGDAYLPVAAAAAEAARRSDTAVFFVPGGLMVTNGLDELSPILQNTSVLVVSSNESSTLTGDCSPNEAVRRLRETGPEIVVVTLEADGAILASNDVLETIPAFDAAVIDTTGAGDAFAAGLMHAFLDGRTWREAAKTGCAVAAIKIGHVGATGGLPDRLELVRFIDVVQKSSRNVKREV